MRGRASRGQSSGNTFDGREGDVGDEMRVVVVGIKGKISGQQACMLEDKNPLRIDLR